MALPAILCLHGSGVNGTVFKFQLNGLQRLLSKTFDFVFLDGPFERDAGYGVLPFFEGFEPFFRWKSRSDDIQYTEEEVEKETKVLIENILKTRDDWVGILGFSQGGRLAAGLLSEQEKREEEDPYSEDAAFKFGVFFMTPSPPMTSLVYEEGEWNKIQTPSIHIAGKQDYWHPWSLKLRQDYFEEETSNSIEIDIGHTLPTALVENTAIAREILRLYLETTGIRGILSQS